MTPPRVKPVLAWALITPEGLLWPLSVRETKAEIDLWPQDRARGWRIARVEIREIEEGQDDDHNRSNSHEH